MTKRWRKPCANCALPRGCREQLVQRPDHVNSGNNYSYSSKNHLRFEVGFWTLEGVIHIQRISNARSKVTVMIKILKTIPISFKDCQKGHERTLIFRMVTLDFVQKLHSKTSPKWIILDSSRADLLRSCHFSAFTQIYSVCPRGPRGTMGSKSSVTPKYGHFQKFGRAISGLPRQCGDWRQRRQKPWWW